MVTISLSPKNKVAPRLPVRSEITHVYLHRKCTSHFYFSRRQHVYDTRNNGAHVTYRGDVRGMFLQRNLFSFSIVCLYDLLVVFTRYYKHRETLVSTLTYIILFLAYLYLYLRRDPACPRGSRGPTPESPGSEDVATDSRVFVPR